MRKKCPNCGREFETPYPSKVYCGIQCATAAYYKRDESDYEFLPDSAEPLYSFECKNCGKTVNVYSKYDQRTVYCCGQCAAAWNAKQVRLRYHTKRRGSNIGMSGGMSLGSLIKRESRSVDKEETIYVKECPNCGAKFETKRTDKKYCSIRCQILAEKKRWKKRKANNESKN